MNKKEFFAAVNLYKRQSEIVQWKNDFLPKAIAASAKEILAHSTGNDEDAMAFANELASYTKKLDWLPDSEFSKISSLIEHSAEEMAEKYGATFDDGVLEHGTKWKDHKYIRIENGRYIYPEDLKRNLSRSTNSNSVITKGRPKNVIDPNHKTDVHKGDKIDTNGHKVGDNSYGGNGKKLTKDLFDDLTLPGSEFTEDSQYAVASWNQEMANAKAGVKKDADEFAKRLLKSVSDSLSKGHLDVKNSEDLKQSLRYMEYNYTGQIKTIIDYAELVYGYKLKPDDIDPSWLIDIKDDVFETYLKSVADLNNSASYSKDITEGLISVMTELRSQINKDPNVKNRSKWGKMSDEDIRNNIERNFNKSSEFSSSHTQSHDNGSALAAQTEGEAMQAWKNAKAVRAKDDNAKNQSQSEGEAYQKWKDQKAIKEAAQKAEGESAMKAKVEGQKQQEWKDKQAKKESLKKQMVDETISMLVDNAYGKKNSSHSNNVNDIRYELVENHGWNEDESSNDIKEFVKRVGEAWRSKRDSVDSKIREQVDKEIMEVVKEFNKVKHSFDLSTKEGYYAAIEEYKRKKA